MKEKIIQIIPAPLGIVARFRESEDTTLETPVVCFGLTNEGRVLPMDLTNDGYIVEIDPEEFNSSNEGLMYGELFTDGLGNARWIKQ